MRKLTILGSTGSIGKSTLDIVRSNPDKFQVFALAAGENLDTMLAQILEFRPRLTVMGTEHGVTRLSKMLAEAGLPKTESPELLIGSPGLVAVATVPETDVVVSAIVGVAGLEATYEAARAGKRVGLANKEALVSGGKLLMNAVAESGAELIPIDSEHNGAHQCLRAGERADVTRLILTASGGPFRTTPKESLASVTPAQALDHPTWKMGPRITIDSATLMNKGLEVIEACWLFGFEPREVGVVIHPQSSVHAMVEFRDGSVLAQISATDMRMPIQYALTYPERFEAAVPKLNWECPRSWDFSPPDPDRFPLLPLAYRAQETGGSATCTLNAADEVAVDAFLKEEIPFTGISEIIEETLARLPGRQPSTIGDILEIDKESRSLARAVIRERSGNPVRA